MLALVKITESEIKKLSELNIAVSIFLTLLTLLIFLTGGDFAVAKNQTSPASLGDLCASVVNSSFFPELLGRRIAATAKNKLGTLLSSETYQYDLRSQLTGYTGPTGSIGYGYDPAGNLAGAKSSTPGGYDISYDYDTQNRITMVHRGQQGIDPIATQLAAYNYDANGNLNGSGYVNGIQHSYTYNALNRLTNLNVARSVGVSPTSLQSYAYQLNKNGHRTQITELSGRTINNTFDAIHRLTREAITLQSGLDILSQPSPTAGTLSYIYDPVGNRTSRTTTGPVATIIPNQTQSFTVNDRLTTDTYDSNGNTLVSKEGGTGVSPVSSSSVTDVYSFDNKLIRRTTPDGKTIDLTYNPDGHRLSKFITQNALTQRLVHYLTDANNPTGYAQVIEEKDPLAASGQELKKVNLYGHDLISSEGGTGVSPVSSIFYDYDGLGSVRGITNSTGDLTETYDYDAYGTLIGLAKRNPTTGLLESSPITDHSALLTQSEYLFTGEQFDSDLGMYFLRARYLDTNTGRFHTQDTYEGRNGEPITLHKYLYANGNPVSYIDLNGHFGLPDSAAVIGGLQTLARFTFSGAFTGGVIGAIVGSQTQLGVLRGAWVGALGGAALQIGYMTGRLNEVVWNGILNAIGSSVTYLAQQSFGDSINWSGLINPVASGFAYGALSSATIGLLGFESWKTQAGVAALVAAITSGVSDIIDAASGNSRFNLGATILRAVGNATIAAITQPAAAASLLSGARGANASPVTIELFERAASDSRSFQLLQALIAGSYATVPSTIADNL